MAKQRNRLNSPGITVSQNPTPDDEAADFDNKDDKLATQRHNHAQEDLRNKQGWIGRITGSTNEALNSGILLLILLLIVLSVSEFGLYYKPEAFSSLEDNLTKVVFTVAGFIFGSKVTGRSR